MPAVARSPFGESAKHTLSGATPGSPDWVRHPLAEFIKQHVRRENRPARDGLQCCVWTGPKDRANADGMLWVDGKRMRVRRVVALLKHGAAKIGTGYVLSVCGTAFCVHPAHLRVVSRYEDSRTRRR